MSEQEYACYIDWAPGEEMDKTCVFDEDRPEDCMEAMHLLKENKTKWDCPYWRSEEISNPKSQWKPIETAPKDGRPVLVYDPGLGYPYVCRFRHGIWVEASGEEFNVSFPTHWMPLPDPPEDK